MKFIIAVIAVVAFADTCYGIDLRPYNETAFGMFLGVDTNGDGVLTRLELEASFDKYDANGDGVETRNEYTDYICAVTPSLYQLAHYLYDEYDVNGDHHLRIEDYNALFVAFDADADGSCTADEFIQYWEVIFPKYANINTHAHSNINSVCH